MTYADDVLRTLQSHSELKVKRQTDGTYRMNNPLKPASDSHAFVLTIDDGTHGAYYDHASGEKGSLFELGDALGLARPELKPAQLTKRTYTDIRDYARAHGLTVADLHRAGWESVTYMNRPALSFPTQNGKRYRFLDNQKPVYINEQGYTVCWYGLDSAIQMAKTSDRALVLCNGEISTVAGQTFGVPAICVTSGEKSIPEHLLKELNDKWQGDVIIALDCDETGRATASKIKAQLPRAKVANLGLTDGGDLADFCMFHQYETASTLHLIAVDTPIQSTEQPDAPTPQTYTMSDLVNVLRQLQTAQSNNLHGVDMERVLDRAQQVVSTARHQHGSVSVVSGRDIAQGSKQAFLDRVDNPSQLLGYTTGLREIDKITFGLQKQKLYYFMAGTNQGKSSLMRTFILALQAQGRGLVAPTESGDKSYVESLVAMMAGEDYLTVLFPNRISHNDPNRKARLRSIETAYDLVTDTIDILQKGSPTIGNIRDALDKDTYDWCIVDSVSNMGGVGSIYERTSTNSKGLIGLTKDYNLALIATVQTGRNSKDRANKEPEPMDAKGAGDIEEDADTLFSVYNHQWWVDRGEAQPDWQNYPQDTIKIRCIKDRWFGRGGSFCNLAWGKGGRLITHATGRIDNVAG